VDEIEGKNLEEWTTGGKYDQYFCRNRTAKKRQAKEKQTSGLIQQDIARKEQDLRLGSRGNMKRNNNKEMCGQRSGSLS